MWLESVRKRPEKKRFLLQRKYEKLFSFVSKGFLLLSWRECGYNSEQAAYMAIKAALERAVREPAEELRSLEAQRLDTVLASIWEHATQHVTTEDEVAYAVVRGLVHEAALPESDALLEWLGEFWKRATGGHLAHIDRVLTIMHRRAALLGLDKPFKHAETDPEGNAPAANPQGIADEFVVGVAQLLAQYGQLGRVEAGAD